MQSTKNITIVGSGLVGSLLSIYLAKKKFRVQIFERRQDMRKNRISAGKSINLALSDRGWKALEEVGIADEIRKISIPMYGRQVHLPGGQQVFQPYGKNGQAIYSVSRGGINCTLMDLAEAQEGVQIFFNERCTQVDLNTATAWFENTESNEKKEVKADLLFGADGAFSAARTSQQFATDRFNYQQYYIDCGYKELMIPAGDNGAFRIEKNALHIWPRGSFMLIALPNFDGSFTCTLFMPFDGPNGYGQLKTPGAVMEFFQREFSDALELMPTLKEDFFANPTSSLVTVKCFPWVSHDKVALIGDAAHAIVPFFGQGMNCGFEDCSVLNGLMEKYADNWPAILENYQTLRKPDSDAIADLAIANFTEMRDTVANPDFQLRKKIEAAFHEKFPEKWVPAYSMVTFSPHIRYSEALRRGKEQEKIMDEVMQIPDIAKNWDKPEVERFILQKLS